MTPAVDHVHHRHRHHVRVAIQIAVQRHAGWPPPPHAHSRATRRASHSRRASIYLPCRRDRSARLVDRALLRRVRALKLFRDRPVDVGDRLQHALAAVAFRDRRRATPALRERRSMRPTAPPRGRVRRRAAAHQLRSLDCRANRESRARELRKSSSHSWPLPLPEIPPPRTAPRPGCVPPAGRSLARCAARQCALCGVAMRESGGGLFPLAREESPAAHPRATLSRKSRESRNL